MIADKAAGEESHLREQLAARAEKAWRPAALLVAITAVWWAIARFKLVAAYLVPSPGDTWHVITDQWSYLWSNTWVTSYETLIGFAIAIIVGVLVALLMVYSPTAEKTLYPLLLFAQVVPKIAIAPLFVVWLGFGVSPKIVITVLIAFFPVVISMVAGLKSVDPEILDLASTMGSSSFKTFVKIRLPASLPHLFSGLKVAVTLAVTGAVVGEFVGANSGLGYVILQATGNLDTPSLFAGLLLMSAIGVVLFCAIEAAEALALPWHASRRTRATT
ncbi:ABC transporter permease [Streptomyces sp. HYC2]|uniref:ABC transporter permease n=1 Tax=Streptomyces sp. HYC2 TaxID=2955207 RepID=UPI00248100C9|nr:ABC transporter permease [Streptomyces sp. HYC2]